MKNEILVNSKTLYNRFYQLAIQYIKFADISHDINIMYPRIYLERHILELLFKLYIFKNVDNQKVVCNGKNVFSVIIYGVRYFSITHSLLKLLEIVLMLDNKLIKDFEDTSAIISEIQKWDDFDHDNERFKYPISKKGRISNKHPISVSSEINISSEINFKNINKVYAVGQNSIFQFKYDTRSN